MSCPNTTITALIGSVHAEIATRRTNFHRKSDGPIKQSIYSWGDTLDFSANGSARRFLGTGWSLPEPHHCWTEGISAELRLPVTPAEGTGMLLKARLSPHVSAKVTAQLARISVNGAALGQWLVSGPGSHHLVIFERHLSGKDRLSLHFELPRAFSPQSQGLSADPRLLALAFHSLSLCPVNFC